MDEHERPSILPLSPHAGAGDLPDRAPGGLERLLGLAAAEPRFAAALLADREAAAAAAGIGLTAAERRSLLAPGPDALRRLIASMAPRLGEPDRRTFLGLAGGALLALAAGGAPAARATPGPARPLRGKPATGARPDRPPGPDGRLGLEITTVRVLRGKLGEAAVRAGIRTALHLVERCANDAHRAGKRLGPQIVLGLIVSPAGRTTKLLVRGDGDARDLEPCLQPRMPQFRFAAVPGPDPSHVSVTLKVTRSAPW